jgi:co-chaperonin GroES (HSP10)
MAYDPTTIRPNKDFVSVLMEERKVVLDSGIILPGFETGVEKVTEGAGTIVRIGLGELNEKLGLEIGMRILLRSFLKYANTIETDEKWPSGAKKEYFLMSSKDIMAILPVDANVGVFSRPAVTSIPKETET